MKIKDVTLNNLKVLLSSIPREKLYNESIESVENKWQALTVRSKIIGLIKEANKLFEEKIEKADELLAKFREEHKLLASQYEVEDKKEEKPEDKKSRLKEKAKAEQELNDRINDQTIKETGLKLMWYLLSPGNQSAFPKYADENASVEIDIKFDEKHKHSQFIREQIETNMFSLNVADEILAELHDTFS